MLGLLQLIQLILSLLCGLLFWGEVIGKALVITTILIIAAIIYRAGKIKGENGETESRHVCKDGPVFNAEEVEW